MTRVTAANFAPCHHFAVSSGPIFVREWTAGAFHHRVLELEAQGYTARRETYRITAEMDPETGAIRHLHAIELLPPEPSPSQ